MVVREEEHYERGKARVDILIAVHFKVMSRKRWLRWIWKKVFKVGEKERLGDPIGDSLWGNVLFFAVIMI